MKAHRNLWQKAFRDPEEYMDYYFSHKALRSGVYSDYDDGKLCAMAYFTPYPAVFMGKKCKAHYIVGVATEAEYRHQRRMTRLLEQGIMVCHQEGSPLVFLSPEKLRVYQSLGFEGTYWRETTTVTSGGSSWFRSISFNALREKEKGNVAGFAGTMLAAEGFELYLEHSLMYYQEVVKEMNALGGDVLVLYDDREIVAAVNYIYEDAQYEVTELICRPEMGKKVVETICAHLRTSFLIIDDSYFISDLEGDGISREKQEKPYIMYRTTSAEESPVLKCYINDIT